MKISLEKMTAFDLINQAINQTFIYQFLPEVGSR